MRKSKLLQENRLSLEPRQGKSWFGQKPFRGQLAKVREVLQNTQTELIGNRARFRTGRGAEPFRMGQVGR